MTMSFGKFSFHFRLFADSICLFCWGWKQICLNFKSEFPCCRAADEKNEVLLFICSANKAAIGICCTSRAARRKIQSAARQILFLSSYTQCECVCQQRRRRPSLCMPNRALDSILFSFVFSQGEKSCQRDNFLPTHKPTSKNMYTNWLSWLWV